jgi:hypothetical protein
VTVDVRIDRLDLLVQQIAHAGDAPGCALVSVFESVVFGQTTRPAT